MLKPATLVLVGLASAAAIAHAFRAPFPGVGGNPVLDLIAYHDPGFHTVIRVWYYMAPAVAVMLFGSLGLFFQLINRRYERASTVLTSNKGFEEWGQILGDEVMAAALIDRLLHHCHIVNIRGSSYRMRKHTDLSKILHSPPAESSPSPPKRKRARAKEKTTN